MMGFFDRYVRWRHSRGFGVHSTFAYYLIIDALYMRRPYAYYAEFLPALDGREGSHAPLARRFYRMAVYLRARTGAESIGVAGPLPDSCRAALRLAGLSVTDPDPSAPSLYYGAPAPDGEFPGLRLDARRWTLLIPRPQMAFTRYSLP